MFQFFRTLWINLKLYDTFWDMHSSPGSFFYRGRKPTAVRLGAGNLGADFTTVWLSGGSNLEPLNLPCLYTSINREDFARSRRKITLRPAAMNFDSTFYPGKDGLAFSSKFDVPQHCEFPPLPPFFDGKLPSTSPLSPFWGARPSPLRLN